MNELLVVENTFGIAIPIHAWGGSVSILRMLVV
jgi:hypothetical protein